MLTAPWQQRGVAVRAGRGQQRARMCPLNEANRKKVRRRPGAWTRGCGALASTVGPWWAGPLKGSGIDLFIHPPTAPQAQTGAVQRVSDQISSDQPNPTQLNGS
jgi:hypothetical protein